MWKYNCPCENIIVHVHVHAVVDCLYMYNNYWSATTLSWLAYRLQRGSQGFSFPPPKITVVFVLLEVGFVWFIVECLKLNRFATVKSKICALSSGLWDGKVESLNSAMPSLLASTSAYKYPSFVFDSKAGIAISVSVCVVAWYVVVNREVSSRSCVSPSSCLLEHCSGILSTCSSVDWVCALTLWLVQHGLAEEYCSSH